MKESNLDNNWKLTRVADGSTVPAEIPGDNISALYKAGLIPDPYFGKNELDLQWIGRENWIFSTSFYVDKDFLENPGLLLRFDSIDTISEVRLNGKLTGKTENMFREYIFDPRQALQEGENLLEVRILSAENRAAVLAEALPYPVPHSEYPIQSPHRNLIRKAQCHAGWDWGPSLMVSGIYGRVVLTGFSEPIIDKFHTDTIMKDDSWNININMEIRSPFQCETEISAECMGEEIRAKYHLEEGLNRKNIELRIAGPELWWPSGYGAQPLYELKVKTPGGSKSKMIGFRTLEVLTRKDDRGIGMVFRVNGKDIFCKGANWIPMDAMPGRESPKRFEELLDSALKANMNMIRVWGGGKYEQEVFYEICDRKGLMIWQDFMFACSTYPSDTDFLDNVKLEAEYQIKRLKDHPSLAIWCGNNENVGALNSFKDTKNEQARYLIDYYKLNEAVVGETVKNLDPGRKWWSSSPSAGESDFSDCWHDDTKGDMHYWSVWHEGKPFEAYYEVMPRFCSEFGFQSFSSPETVSSFANKDQFNITSPVMEHHQRNNQGNTIIATTLSRYYRFPESFEETLYLSRIQQALAITTAVEYWRTKRPVCMGALYWQLNDNWPVASWSSLEYGGKWKPLHYSARRFFEPIHPVILREDKKVRIYLCNDTLSETAGILFAEILDFKGRKVKSMEKKCRAAAEASVLLEEFILPEEIDPADHFCTVLFSPETIENPENKELENILLLAPPKACSIEKSRIDVRIENDTVILSSDVPAFNVWLELPAGFELSDNNFTLIPGREKRLEFRKKNGDFSMEKVKIHSLRNFRSDFIGYSNR